MGLLPDGEPLPVSSSDDAKAAIRTNEYPWTVREAMHTGAFWRLAIGFGAMMLSMSAIRLWWVPHFVSRDFDPQLAAWGYSSYALTQAAGSAALAPFIDRFQPRFLAAGGFVSVILAFIVLMTADSIWQMFLAAVLGGTGVGVGMLMQAQMWPVYFGRRNIGAVRGAAVPVTLTFSGAGSSAAGMIFDATGTYAPAWGAAIGVLALGAVLLILTPKPQPSRLRCSRLCRAGTNRQPPAS